MGPPRHGRYIGGWAEMGGGGSLGSMSALDAIFNDSTI